MLLNRTRIRGGIITEINQQGWDDMMVAGEVRFWDERVPGWIKHLFILTT